MLCGYRKMKALNVVLALILLVAVSTMAWRGCSRTEPTVAAPDMSDRPKVAKESSATSRPILDQGKAIARVEKVLTTGPGKIMGRVYQSDGTPADAAEVRALYLTNEEQPPEKAPSFETTSVETGQFEFSDLPFGGYAIVAVSDDYRGASTCRLMGARPFADVTLVLHLATPLGGTVVGPGGEPVTAGRLYPLLLDGKSNKVGIWRGLAEEIGADGTFLFESLEPGAWSIHVVAPGFAPTLSPPIKTGKLDARIALGQGVSVDGHVLVEPSLEPAAGAVVRVEDEAVRGPGMEVVCDGAGYFHFAALAPGSYTLGVREATGTLALDGDPLSLTVASKRIGDLELRLQPGGIVEGRVWVADTGEGIPEAEIEIRREGAMEAAAVTAICDGTGHYAIGGLSSGTYVVQPEKQRAYSSSTPASATVIVNAGTRLEGVDFSFESGIIVSGRVLTATGEPQAGARVTANGTPSMSLHVSDAEGEFVIPNANAGREITLYASTATMSSEPLGPLLVPETGLHGLDLILTIDQSAVIAGVLVDTRGRPLVGRVAVVPEQKASPSVPGATTDAQGRFVIAGVAPGRHMLSARAGNGPSQELQSVELRSGQHLKNVRLVYELGPTISISGRVTDGDGRGLEANLDLMVQEERGRTSMANERSAVDGAFAFTELPQGAYTVSGSAPGFGSAWVSDIMGDTSGLEIVLEAQPQIRGHVVDAAGQPVTRFDISAVPAGGGFDAAQVSKSVFDAEGAFDLQVGIGTYRLVTRATGFATAETRVGAVHPGDPIEDIVVTLEAAGLWRGRVVSTSGQPVSGAAILAGDGPLRPQQAHGSTLATSGPDGTFEIPSMDPALNPVISAHHPEAGTGAVASPPVGVDQLEDIVLYAGGSVAVIVTRDGEPVADTYVALSGGTSTATGKTDENGSCLFENLPEGELKVEVIEPGEESVAVPETVVVEPGRETQVSLEI